MVHSCFRFRFGNRDVDVEEIHFTNADLALQPPVRGGPVPARRRKCRRENARNCCRGRPRSFKRIFFESIFIDVQPQSRQFRQQHVAAFDLKHVRRPAAVSLPAPIVLREDWASDDLPPMQFAMAQPALNVARKCKRSEELPCCMHGTPNDSARIPIFLAIDISSANAGVRLNDVGTSCE